MPVLDFHIHVRRRSHLVPRFLAYYEEALGPGVTELLDGLTPRLMDDFLALEGIDRGVLLAEYSPEVTAIVPSEFVADFCREKDRLIPFASLDLWSGIDTGTQVEAAVKDLGCRGIKLLPSYGRYFPDDDRLLPAYEVASDLGIPVMFHTGTSLFPGTRVRYADPLLLDDVAEDFPSLPIVMSHGGRPFWYKEAEWMLRRHENVHIDVSGIPPKKLIEAFPRMASFPDRFIFGSDWPNIPSIAAQVKRIQELPLAPEIIDAILWDNGARLLGLGPSGL